MDDRIGSALRAAMMQSDRPMALSDPNQPDCPLVAINPAFTAVTGYGEAESLGRNCRFLQCERTDPDTPARIRDCLAAGQGCIEWIVNRRRGGGEFWNLLFISPVRDETGALRYFFGNQLDITHGLPEGLPDVSFGRAHVVPRLEAEFHALLRDVSDAEHRHAVEGIIAAAHRLAELTVKLAPGTLERV